MKQRRPLLIAAGGTGGHVFPALAVAEYLAQHKVPVLWLGTRHGLEARLVPAADIPIEWLQIERLKGQGWCAWMLLPWRLSRACWQVFRILRRHRPAAVLGMGGFVSGPTGLMAWLLDLPLLIHEQNRRPGLTNRILARLADVVMEGFPKSFLSRFHAQAVGHPLRLSWQGLALPKQRFRGRYGAMRLLVLGGSQGARSLNQILPQALAMVAEESRPALWHQTGVADRHAVQQSYQQQGVQARVDAFIDPILEAYCWADFVICRAGAMTTAELMAVGIGALLIPLPQAADDHQYCNGEYLLAHGAALLWRQERATVSRLAELLTALAVDSERRLRMAEAARQLAEKDASAMVGEQCLKAMR